MLSDSTASTKRERRRENLEREVETFWSGPMRRVIMAAGSRGRVTARPSDLRAVTEVTQRQMGLSSMLLPACVDLYNATIGEDDRPDDDRLAEIEQMLIGSGALSDG